MRFIDYTLKFYLSLYDFMIPLLMYFLANKPSKIYIQLFIIENGLTSFMQIDALYERHFKFKSKKKHRPEIPQ